MHDQDYRRCVFLTFSLETWSRSIQLSINGGKTRLTFMIVRKLKFPLQVKVGSQFVNILINLSINTHKTVEY